MTPLLFLGVVISVTALASLVNTILRRRWREQLLKLAGESKMAYSHHDRFNLSDRVAQHFPIPGVASLRVIDLLYASEAGGYRYVFSAEYTNGVIRSKHRKLRAATFYESPAVSDAVVWSTLTLAPAELPLFDQYKKLVEGAGTPK
jgi:hypothetical protein